MKRMLSIAALLAVTLATLLWLRLFQSPPATRATGPAAPIATPAACRIVAPGTVEAASEEILVRAEVAGRITAITVEEAQHVSFGQVIVTLDDSRLRTHEDAVRAEVQQRQAELSAVLNGTNQLQRREAQRAEAALKASQALLRDARLMLGKTVIRTPIAGVVLPKYLLRANWHRKDRLPS